MARMDDALHLAQQRSNGTSGYASDGWRVTALLIAAMVGLVIATAGGVALLIMDKLDAALVPTQLQILAQNADARARAFESYGASTTADVLTFSHGKSLDNILKIASAPGPVDLLALQERREDFAARLLGQLRRKPVYYRFRLIEAAGREFIRVEQTANGPRIVPDAELQEMGDRPFFRQAMALSDRQIYVSPLGLNQEHGQIEHPLVPVVRVATPVLQPDGRRFGILVVNLDLRPFLAETRALAPPNGDIRIIDENGEYLLHPDPTREFRFDQGGRSRLADDFPDLGPLPTDVATQRLTRDINGKLFGVATAPGQIGQSRRFSVVEVVPYAALAAAPQPVREATLIGGAIAATCATLIAIVLANLLSRRLRKVVATVDNLSQEELAAVERTPDEDSGLQRLFGLPAPERELERELVRRRHNELLLQTYLERDQLYAAVVRSASDAIITRTPEGKITGWNAAAVQLFGYAAAEAVGQSIDIIVPHELIDESNAMLDTVRRGEHIDHCEAVRRTRSGRLIDVSLGISPVRAPSGEIIGSAEIVRDISEQKFNQRKFELAVEASPGGVLMINQSGEIVLANAELERQFGYQRDELLGTSVDMLLPEAMRGQHAEHRATFLAAPAAGRIGTGRELRGVRKDGSEFPVEIGLNPIESRDGLLVLATVIDITGRREAERAIEAQNERLRRSNAELEQFAYVASHDLQEPLRMVASYTQLLEERYKDRLDDKANRYIAYAVEGAQRMQILVRDLLSYSRLSSKETANRVVDSAAVVAATLARLSHAIEETGADIHVGALPVVLSEEIELEQVFQNLISNAIKFRNRRPPRIEISAQPREALWEFTIKDNGIGIEARHGSRIFQMFQRLHERGKYDGSGIGLAIVKKIVERHGGTIWFDSTSGEGTNFHFTALALSGPTTTRTTTEMAT